MQPGRCGHRPLRRRHVSPSKRATARVAPTKRSKAFGKTGRRGRRPPRHSVEKRCVGADASVRPPDLYRISCDVSLRSQCARWSPNPYSFCRAGCPHPAIPVLHHTPCTPHRGRCLHRPVLPHLLYPPVGRGSPCPPGLAPYSLYPPVGADAYIGPFYRTSCNPP